VSQSSSAPTASIRSPTATVQDDVAAHVTKNAPAAAKPQAEASSPLVKAYQSDIIDGHLAEVLAKGKEVGGVVDQQVHLIVTLADLRPLY
jgi:hypothetical protein